MLLVDIHKKLQEKETALLNEALSKLDDLFREIDIKKAMLYDSDRFVPIVDDYRDIKLIYLDYARRIEELDTKIIAMCVGNTDIAPDESIIEEFEKCMSYGEDTHERYEKLLNDLTKFKEDIK